MTPPRPDRVIVLAAGMGLRLGALTPDRPKALVEVAGRALVEHALRFAAWFDPRETVVVTGFHRDLVEAHLDSLAMPRVRLVDNPACAGGNLRSVDAFDGGYAGLTFVADAACARVRRASTQSAGPKSTRRRISGAPGRASVRRTRPAAARRTAGNGESDRRHRPPPPMTDLAAPDHRGPAVAGRPHHVGHLAPWCGIMGMPMLLADVPGLFGATRCYPGLHVAWAHGVRMPAGVEPFARAIRERAPRIVNYSDLFSRPMPRGMLGGGDGAPPPSARWPQASAWRTRACGARCSTRRPGTTRSDRRRSSRRSRRSSRACPRAGA